MRTLYLRNVRKNNFPEGYFRRDEIVQHISAEMSRNLESYRVDKLIEIWPIAENMFLSMLNNSAFGELSDDFAGQYYKNNPQHMDAFRQSELSSDAIHNRASAIGEERYFTDVFESYIGGSTGESLVGALSLAVPASDRIVTVSHNQQAIVEPALTALIDDVRSDSEPLDGDVKDRLLGQLRAGRELIQSGSIRAYLLYHTLIRGLVELVARYRGRAIGIAAEKLIELLVEHIFQNVA